MLRYVFDLKGSLVDREVKNASSPTDCLKDVNFLRVKKVYHDFLKTDEETRMMLKKAMAADVEFLRENGLMDYSMLVALEKKEELDPANCRRMAIKVSSSVKYNFMGNRFSGSVGSSIS